MINIMKGKFMVWGARDNDLPSSMIVRTLRTTDLPIKFFLKPKNMMLGKLEVVERPSKVVSIKQAQDACIRQSIPTLNYGTDKTMLVGYSDSFKEIYRSFIKFDITAVPTGKDIKIAKLRLFNMMSNNLISLDLYEIQSNWEEQGITWVGQPQIGEFIKTANITNQYGYIEIDVTEIVSKWTNFHKPNNGFAIRLSDEKVDTFTQFVTKEGVNKPELEVTYYEDAVSVGQSKLPISLTIRRPEKTDLPVSMKVFSKNVEEDLPISFTIQKFNDIEELYSIMIVKSKAFNEMPVSLSIEKKERSSDLNTQLYIKHTDDLQSIFSIEKKNTDIDLPASFHVRAIDETNLSSSFEIQKKNRDNNITATLHVRAKLENSIPASFQIIKKEAQNEILASMTLKATEVTEIPTSITIPHKEDLNTSMSIIHKSDLQCSMYINSGFLAGQLMIQGSDFNDLQSSFTVKVKSVSEINTILELRHVSEINCELTIAEREVDDGLNGNVFIT